jgi:ketosteroid isomerase-like protein
MDPELEIHSQMTNSVYRGAEGLSTWAAEIDEQFESWRIEISQIHGISAEKVLVVGEIHVRGRKSGVGMDQGAAWIVELRDGRILRIRNFVGADAIEAARALTEPDRG